MTYRVLSIIALMLIPMTTHADVDRILGTDSTIGIPVPLTGAEALAVIPSATVTLEQARTNGNVISGAVSEATAVTVGDGTRCEKMWGDVTSGFMRKPCILGDNVIRIWPDQRLIIRDEEAAADIWIYDPDAVGQKGVFQTGYRPRKSFWISAGNIYGDGTQCPTRPTAVTINSGPKLSTFICADNNGSRLNFAFSMPADWDGDTFTLTQKIIQTAADTNALNGDTAWQCRGNGEAVSNTWGTEVPMDLANVSGSNKNDFITSGAITAAGTCAGGDMLYGYWDMDATGTTTAVSTLHILGFLLTYGSTQ